MDTEDVDALSSDSEDNTGEEQKLSGEIQKLILEVLVLLAHVAWVLKQLARCSYLATYWAMWLNLVNSKKLFCSLLIHNDETPACPLRSDGALPVHWGLILPEAFSFPEYLPLISRSIRIKNLRSYRNVFLELFYYFIFNSHLISMWNLGSNSKQPC